LVEAFEQPVPTIHVNVNKNIGDITIYVEKRIRSSRSMSRIPKTQRPIIEETLIEKAEGMFLWVDLMLTELNGKTRASSMLESLHKAPKGLDAMLSHTLKTLSSRLNEEQAIELNIILRWVACADRPLTLLELEEILCVELDTDDGRLGLEDALRTQYASLLVLNREDGFTTADLVAEGRRSFDKPQGDSPAENNDSSYEQKPEFNSLKGSTTAVFCHASIRDYLRNPGYGKVSAGESSTPVGVEIVQASFTVLNISLEAIFTASVQSAMRDNALFHWVDQMRHACKYQDRVDQDQKQETIILLCQIFRCANLQMFYTYTYPTPVIRFINRETMDMIISIFADQECVNGIDDIETREWIRFCVRNPAQIFVPLGREVAHRWLVGNWNPSFCMVTVLRVVTLLRGEDYSHHTSVVFVDRVLEVARWAQFEENARWHHHVGACLSELTYYDAAIEHLNISVTLEPTWRAKRDLADVFAKLNRLKDSLRLLKECNAHYAPLPIQLRNSAPAMNLGPRRERTRALSEVREKIALLQIQLGNHSRATKWLMKSIELWDFVQIPTAVTLIIRLVASKSSRDGRIMQLLKALDYDPWSYNVTAFSLVVMESFMNWYDWDNAQLPLVFAVCAKSCGDLQWLECKYQTLIRESSSQVVDNICLQELLAHLYDKFLDEEGKAKLIWKSIIAQRRIPGSPYYEKYRRARNRAVSGYASRLLANSLRTTGNPQALILSELERVCDAEIQSLPIVNFLFDGQPGIHMGIWHKINKREKEARRYFRPYILHALAWRNGGVVGKNFQPIQRVIGHLLAMIGDENDAITLLQLVHSLLDLRDGTSVTPEERMAAPWPLVVRDRV
jgi:tetratricopeptide (TPR) repeat protein